MERFTAFNGGLSQRTTFKTSDPSALCPSFSCKAHPNDACSSYLGSEDRKSVAIDDNWSMKTSVEPAETTPTATKITGLNRRINDVEISIFDAEKYFNGNHEGIQKGSVTMNLEKISQNGGVFQKPSNTGEFSECLPGSSVPRDSSVSSTDGFCRNYRTGPFSATPTASSEASWNSQSGLLSNPPGSIAVSVRNLPLNEQKKSFSYSSKWLFGGKCPCSGKKSVDVEEKFSDPRNPETPICDSTGSSRGGSPLNSKQQEKPSLTKKLETLAMAEANKLKLVAVNGETDPDKLRNSDRYSPEIRFQAEIGRRIIPSGGPFNGEDGGFSFPILNLPTENLTGKSSSPPEERPRCSLEVFRPLDEAGQRKTAEWQKRLTSFPGDNTCRNLNFPASSKTLTTDYDLESDSSSDLFEIESFSTQPNSFPMYRRRDSLDEISSLGVSDAVSAVRRFVGNPYGILHYRQNLEDTVTPSEYYEPSEVSVDWSVTTAEGYDRGSVTNFSTTASEISDARFIKAENGKSAAGSFKRCGNGLWSCRWEKAVNVAPRPVNVGQKTSTRKLTDGNGAHVLRVSDRPALARSHSARFSRPLSSR